MNVNEIREALGTVETQSKLSIFDHAKWNAENAFNRLKIIRKAEKDLIIKINDNVDGLPTEIRKKYDRVINLMKDIEEDEIKTIKFGE